MDINEQRLKELTHNRSTVDKWETLGRSDVGKFLISDLRESLEITRGFYGKLPVNTEHCPAILAGVQGQENCLVAILDKLTRTEEYKRKIDEEIKELLQLINDRKQDVPRTSRFVSAEAIKEHQND